MNEHIDPNHHIVKDKDGTPLCVVIPYQDYVELIENREEELTVPNDVLGLIVLQEYSVVKAWRVFKQLSQKEVADRMGITQATFSRYEKPDVNLQVKTLQKIADALGVDTQQMLSTWGER